MSLDHVHMSWRMAQEGGAMTVGFASGGEEGKAGEVGIWHRLSPHIAAWGRWRVSQDHLPSSLHICPGLSTGLPRAGSSGKGKGWHQTETEYPD